MAAGRAAALPQRQPTARRGGASRESRGGQERPRPHLKRQSGGEGGGVSVMLPAFGGFRGLGAGGLCWGWGSVGSPAGEALPGVTPLIFPGFCIARSRSGTEPRLCTQIAPEPPHWRQSFLSTMELIGFLCKAPREQPGGDYVAGLG